MTRVFNKRRKPWPPPHVSAAEISALLAVGWIGHDVRAQQKRQRASGKNNRTLIRDAAACEDGGDVYRGGAAEGAELSFNLKLPGSSLYVPDGSNGKPKLGTIDTTGRWFIEYWFLETHR